MSASFFRAKDKHGFVSIFIVLDNGECGKSFAEPDAVGENAAVVHFELIDAREHGIALKIEEHRPNCALLETGCFVRQNIFGNVDEKFVEDVEERHEIYQRRRIFFVNAREIFDDGLGNISQSITIIPQRFKDLKIRFRFRIAETTDDVGQTISALAAQTYARKTVQRLVNNSVVGRFDKHEGIDIFVGDVRFEFCTSSEPSDAIASDGALSHFVAQFELELRAVETSLAFQFRYDKFALNFIVKFFDKSRSGEHKSKLLGGLELFLQRVVGVKRKTWSGNGNFTSLANDFLQIVADGLIQIIKNNRIHFIQSLAEKCLHVVCNRRI